MVIMVDSCKHRKFGDGHGRFFWIFFAFAGAWGVYHIKIIRVIDMNFTGADPHDWAWINVSIAWSSVTNMAYHIFDASAQFPRYTCRP